MTLVVAAIHDESQITMASDTLVTWDDNDIHAPESSSIAKLMILRREVAVGVTGKDPHGRLRDLVALRDEPIGELLDQLKEDPVAGFVVAALEPARLWEVIPGSIREHANRQLAWDGGPEAHKVFNQHFTNDWIKTSAVNDIQFRVTTAMQALTSFRPVPTVGGITLRIGSDDDGFHFIADRGQVLFGPEWLVFVCSGATRGAIGILDLQRGLGQLFRHDAPDEPVTVHATTQGDFVGVAKSCGQAIVRQSGQPEAHTGRFASR